MKQTPSPKKKSIWKLIGFLFLLAAVMAGIWLLCRPLIATLSTPEGEEELKTWIHSLGMRGWLLFLGLQIVQIVIAFIPGEPVQLIAGMLYGTLGGMLTCLLGSVIASTAIFFAVKKAGERLVLIFFGKDKLDKFAFLRDSERIETVTFILFLIPGIPKDLLTYLAGLTRINPWKFIAISTIARIPALTASTLMGSSASNGNWGLTIALIAGAAVVGLAGVIYRERLMKWLKRHGQKTKRQEEG